MNFPDEAEDRTCFIDLEPDLLLDLKQGVFPKSTTLPQVHRQHFPHALAISYIHPIIVVELPPTTIEQYMQRFVSLSTAFSETDVGLRYHNGLIHG